MEAGSFTIRPLTTLDEMYDAVDLQRGYWGNDIDSVVPAQMLYTIHGGGDTSSGHSTAAD